MPAGPGEDAQRFAAAVEQGRPPGFFGDAELDRDLDLVARLRARRRAYDPSPTAKALAKQRMMTLLTEPEADTVSLGHVLAPAFPVPAGPSGRDAPADLRADVPADVPGGAAPDIAAEAAATANANAVDWAAAELLRHVSRAPSAAATETRAEPATPGADHRADPQAADVPLDELVARAGTDMPSRPVSTAHARRPGGRHSMPSNRPGGRADDSRPRLSGRRRFGLVGSATSVLLIALAGMGMLSSRDALPGQPLYGVKRVAESAGLALTFDDLTKAHRHLQLATTRLDEVEQLVQSDPQLPTERPELVISAIQEFDESTGEGARLLLGTDEASGSADIREKLRSWAAEQLTRLVQLKPALPASTGADDALLLLDRVVVRTEALQVESACDAPTGSVDDLGPVPNCGPNGPGGIDPNSDPALDPAAGTSDPGMNPDQSPDTEPSTSADSRGSSSTSPDSRTRGAPGPSTAPRTSPAEPTRSEAPDAPPEPSTDDPGGALGGGDPGSVEPSTSLPSETLPDDEQNSSGAGLPGLPSVEIPLLPGLPGISL